MIAAIAALWLIAPACHGEPERLAPELNLQASVQTEIPRQQLEITLSASAEGPQPGPLAEQVNKTMQWALAQIRKPVTAETTGYQTQRITRKGETQTWRVSQGLRLQALDDETLLTLAGNLQHRMEIIGMHYHASPSARAQAVERLIPQVIAAFEQRAQIAAAAYRNHCHVLDQASLHTGEDNPRPLYRAAAMEASSNALNPPAGEGGKAEIRLTMQGSIRLVPCSP